MTRSELLTHETESLTPWGRISAFSRFAIAYYNSRDRQTHREVSPELLHATTRELFPDIAEEDVASVCARGLWGNIRQFHREHPDEFSESIDEMVVLAGGGDHMESMAATLSRIIGDDGSHSAKVYLDHIATIAFYGVELPEQPLPKVISTTV